MKETSRSLARFFGQAIPFITILAVITPFVLVESFFFPFITGKAFYFRILVEVMAVLYVFYLIADKSARPKWSPVMWAATIFTGILGLSTILSVDPLRSFWSNYERMEGYILFLHLFAYFLIAGAVMKYKEGWWKWFFRASLAMSVIVGANAFTDLYGSEAAATSYRIYGNLGNSSYLGMYALASFFIAMFFIIRRINRRATNAQEGMWVSISIYSLIALFNLVVLFNTGTRGSFVGLVGGVFVSALLIAIFDRRHKALRITGISLIGVSLLFVLALGLGKNTPFVKNSDMLSRFSELVTFDIHGVLETQGKAREVLWGIAWQGVQDKPVLGWGLDDFHYIFAKYYDPAMSGQEQWFDRSHNVFMDWLTQTGFLGLISYLSLFGTGIYVIWRRKEETVGKHDEALPGTMSVSEKAIITGGLVAYLGHNFFVFDNLTSYVLFFSLLAFLHQYAIRKKVIEAEDPKTRYAECSPVTLTVISLVAVIGFFFILYSANIKPMLANIDLITSLRTQVKDIKTEQVVAVPIKDRFAKLQQSIAYGTMTNSEQREQLADRGAEIFGSSESAEYKMAAHKYIVDQYSKAIERTPKDPRPYFFYSIYLARIGDFQDAATIAEKMVALSPNKLSFINFYAMTQAQLQHKDVYLQLAKRSHELDPTNVEAKKLYIAALAQTGNIVEAEKLAADNMVEYLSDWNVVSAYVTAKQGNRVIVLLEKAIAANPTVLDLRSSLASLYVKIGKPLLGIKELEKVKALAPQYAESINQAIAQIKAEAKIK